MVLLDAPGTGRCGSSVVANGGVKSWVWDNMPKTRAFTDDSRRHRQRSKPGNQKPWGVKRVSFERQRRDTNSDSRRPLADHSHFVRIAHVDVDCEMGEGSLVRGRSGLESYHSVVDPVLQIALLLLRSSDKTALFLSGVQVCRII